jgi:hypothetical protein
MNHDPNSILGGDSMWREIWDQYHGGSGQIPLKVETPFAERYAGLDLGPFIQWRIFE